jgi:hypothetical protein
MQKAGQPRSKSRRTGTSRFDALVTLQHAWMVISHYKPARSVARSTPACGCGCGCPCFRLLRHRCVLALFQVELKKEKGEAFVPPGRTDERRRQGLTMRMRCVVCRSCIQACLQAAVGFQTRWRRERKECLLHPLQQRGRPQLDQAHHFTCVDGPGLAPGTCPSPTCAPPCFLLHHPSIVKHEISKFNLHCQIHNGKSLDHPNYGGGLLKPQIMKRSNLSPELSKTVYFIPWGSFG